VSHVGLLLEFTNMLHMLQKAKGITINTTSLWKHYSSSQVHLLESNEWLNFLWQKIGSIASWNVPFTNIIIVLFAHDKGRSSTHQLLPTHPHSHTAQHQFQHALTDDACWFLYVFVCRCHANCNICVRWCRCIAIVHDDCVENMAVKSWICSRMYPGIIRMDSLTY